MPSKPMTYDRVVERKQQHYRKYVKPSLQNEAEIGQFFGGGRVEKNVDTLMHEHARKQAKASHGRQPIVVDVAFRDDDGIYHYDEESALQYDPLLTPGAAAHHASYRQAYPAWIDMEAARRGSMVSVGSDESNNDVPYADAEELQSAFGGVAPSKSSRRHRRGSLNLSDPYTSAPMPVSAGQRPHAPVYAYDARRDFLASSFAPPPPPMSAPSHSHSYSHPHSAHSLYGAPPPKPMSSQASFHSSAGRARRFTLTSSSSTNVAAMNAPPPPMPTMPQGMYGSVQRPGSSSASVKSSKSSVKNLFRMGRKA